MRLPSFVRTLHFRISAIFLVLLALSIGGYLLLVRATIFSAFDDEIEEAWYEDGAEAELDTLAANLAPLLGTPALVQGRLSAYALGIADFEAEVIYFDADGRTVATTSPDSLPEAVPAVDPALLADMSDGEWDFESYPVAGDVDAYENRIFLVERVMSAGRPEPEGYLAASFEPLTFTVDELNAGERALGIQAVILVLIYAAVSSTILMLWTSRRLRRLSTGVEAFAAGNLDCRVPDSSADEIGVLGGHINAMARRIESMVSELTQKERFQRQLVANVSHDLRTPLANLRGYIETLSLGGRELSEEERKRYLAVVTEKLDHLDRLIEHVLVLSRIDSGQAAFRFEDFSLGELAETVLARCTETAVERGIDLDLHLESGLPDVHADPLQIGRVLQNLVENGIKFTREGGSVTVRARRHDSGIEVQVADNGIGIASEDMPHIFERFYTGDKSRTVSWNGDGTDDHLNRSSGLGLAIASRIVTSHGSRIDVESTEGLGSVFRFVLRRAANETSGAQSA